MPVAGVFETAMTVGAINTSASTTMTHHFGPSAIWAKPQLQRAVGYDHVSDINPDISRFVDATGVNNVSFFALFASQCTSVTFRLRVKEAYARVLCTTVFFTP
ncbi:MAG: hypothetical protein K0U98_08505 [Deltaproteobacteria bacterium]|nr:hypothetical protein [Deltaproteobacteria bacterium]